MTPDDIIHELRTAAGVPNEALRAGVSEVESLRPRRGEARLRHDDPCPCGSGKKFKKCCRGRGGTSETMH